MDVASRIHFFCSILPSYAEQFLYGSLHFHLFRVLGGPFPHHLHLFRGWKCGNRALRGRLFCLCSEKNENLFHWQSVNNVTWCKIVEKSACWFVGMLYFCTRKTEGRGAGSWEVLRSLKVWGQQREEKQATGGWAWCPVRRVSKEHSGTRDSENNN